MQCLTEKSRSVLGWPLALQLTTVFKPTQLSTPVLGCTKENIRTGQKCLESKKGCDLDFGGLVMFAFAGTAFEAEVVPFKAAD
jgi:hypothetical protein